MIYTTSGDIMIAKTRPVQNDIEELATLINNAVFSVRSEMGVGLLDDVYRLCLVEELKSLGLNVKTQVPMPIKNEDVNFEEAYRIDILVEDRAIIEIKPSCSKADLHKARVSTYLRHSGYPLGFLVDYDSKRKKGCLNRVTL